nr:kelch-like protein 10 isoform X1 [Parasteatoda tepidariorum]
MSYNDWSFSRNIPEVHVVFEVPTQPDAMSKVPSSSSNDIQSERTLNDLFSKLLCGSPDSSWSLSPDKLVKGKVVHQFPADHSERVREVPNSLMFAVLGWSGSKPNISIEVFDAISEKWFYLRQKNFIKRAYHGVVAIGIHIYVIGGFDGRNCYNSTYRFHVEKRCWSRRARMLETRCYVTAVGCKGVLYAIGGFDGDVRTSSCEKYVPSSHRWQYIADMNHRRSDASGAVYNDRIFVCGGFDGLNILMSAEIYDIKSNQWTFIAPLLGPRSGHSMVFHNQSILAIGGFDGSKRLKSVEKYEESENQWVDHVPMHSQRSNFAATVLSNELYVMGGYNGLSTFSEVEKFDDKTEKWFKVDNLKRDRSALGACIFNNLEAFSTCSVPGKACWYSTDYFKGEFRQLLNFI